MRKTKLVTYRVHYDDHGEEAGWRHGLGIVCVGQIWKAEFKVITVRVTEQTKNLIRLKYGFSKEDRHLMDPSFRQRRSTRLLDGAVKIDGAVI
jgi:hypothetical protein